MNNHVDSILNFCQVPETIIIKSSNTKFLRNAEENLSQQRKNLIPIGSLACDMWKRHI